MTIRYCPRCKTDVEDTGGYCLLGHRLALEPPVASITDLRAEVDRAFEDARLQVASVMANDDVPTGPMSAVGPASASAAAPGTPSVSPPPIEASPSRRVPPPPPPPRRPSPPPQPTTPVPEAPSAPPPAPPGPSDVPTADEIRSRNASVWKGLDAEVDMVGDPIGAFAPPPHMDWGPERSKPLKRKPSRRPRRPEAAPE